MSWLGNSFLVVLVVAIAVCTARDAINKREHEEYTRLMQRSYEPFHNECEFAATDRHECGKRTYNEDECHKRGCCYEICDNTNCTDVPWCFLAKRMLRDECLVNYVDKEDCGYYGITEGECFIRGCCWAPSPRTNDPPCFAPVEPTVRLVGGTETSTTLSGRVELQRDGVWGTVCDDDFSTRAAAIVCKTLGYPYGQPVGEAKYGEGTGPIVWDGYTCTGEEDSLWECENYGTPDCSHHEDAGAICSTEETAYNTYDQYGTGDTSYPYYGYNYAYEDYGDYDWDRRSVANVRRGYPYKSHSPTKKSAHPLRERETISMRNVGELSPTAWSRRHSKKAVNSPSKKKSFGQKLVQASSNKNVKRKTTGEKSTTKKRKEAPKLSERFEKKKVDVDPRSVETKVDIQPRPVAVTGHKLTMQERAGIKEKATTVHKKHMRERASPTKKALSKLVAELKEAAKKN